MTRSAVSVYTARLLPIGVALEQKRLDTILFDVVHTDPRVFYLESFRTVQ